MINVGIIGAGSWGKNLIREYSKLSNVIICCTKGNKKNIDWIKSNYPKIKHTTNIDEVINNENIDAIVIATPINTHFKLALRSLKANKHVFVEKTLAENFMNAKKILREAKIQKKMLFVGHIFWYHEVLKKLKEITKNDPVKTIILDWRRLGNFNEKISLDLLSHFISILIELVGNPKKMMIEPLGVITPCDIISAKGKLKNGTKFFININRISNVKQRIITIKTTKNLYLWHNDLLFKHNEVTNEFQELYVPQKTALEIECREFINCIMSKRKNYSNAQMATDIMKVLERNGRRII